MSAQRLPAAVTDGTRTVSREDLRDEVARVAAGLAQRGLGAGDRAVVSLRNSYEFVVIHLAVELLGAITVNLPTAFRREVGQVVRMVDAQLTVLGEAHNPREFGDVRELVTVEAGSLRELHGDTQGLLPVQREPLERVWLAFTSGSTGTPRAALHTRASLEASTAAMGDRYGVGPDDTVLVAAPLGHAIGFCYGVRLACDRGSRLVLLERWDPEAALRLVRDECCTFAAIPTPFLADLVDVDPRASAGTLRRLLVGGAPVPADQLAEADRVLGPGVASGYYGASECGAVLSSPPGAPESDRHATVGVPLPAMRALIVDDAGREVPDGEEGELVVYGPQIAVGYWMNNDSDDQFLPDGGFATRDRAVRLKSGAVAVTGRLKDILIRGAVNVVPRELEEAISAHRGVRRAVVVGTPDRRLGERIAAAVTAAGKAPGRDELCAWLDACGLARSKWPDEVIVVDEHPRTPSGKIDRAAVREEVLRRVAAR
jgi:acyl-CoA synthetase (AMP-forming)/AMP-acid ligase II